MLQEQDIGIQIKCQQFESKEYARDQEGKRSVILFESKQDSREVKCPHCGGRVYEDGTTTKHLRDMPIWVGIEQELAFLCHRYECLECGRKFTEGVPLKYPGTRITERAANWIKSLLYNKASIRSIQNVTGIHWETIRRIHEEMMSHTLEEHTRELIARDYHPHYLAVDEFAIHKGHTYATCVMDLESGEVLWVGSGRSIEDFRRFFDEVEPSFLTEIKAVAMDMNASYHKVVQEMLPGVPIVYDRYHMQAQYGKDVLGAVRLEEARRHKARSVALGQEADFTDHEQKQAVQAEIRQEKAAYRQIKKLRWTLLTNGEKLGDERREHLQEILQNHSDLAVCYAMKEEMCRLFSLRDPAAARERWIAWFAAARQSNIPALVRFADLKEQRIEGLIAHATFPISTGKLEGFNNKIKVAKRIAYGFRNDSYFFSLVRLLSLPNFP